MVEKKRLIDKKNILTLIGLLVIVGFIVFILAAPVASITSPQQGGNYSNNSVLINCSFATAPEVNGSATAPNITISYNASGGASIGVGATNITTLNWSFNRTNDANSLTTYNTTFNSLLLTDGKYYNFSCWAQFPNGSILQKSAGNVTIDNTAPAAKFFVIVNYGNYSNHTGADIATPTNLTVNISAIDATVGMVNVSFIITNATGVVNWTTNSTAVHTADNYTFSLDIMRGNGSTKSLGDGKYNLTAIVTDLLNNVNYSSANITFTIDKTVPKTNASDISLPFGDRYNYSGVVSLATTASDAVTSVASLYFNITNSTGENATATASSTTGISWNASFNTSIVPDGIYNVTVWATDSAGNINNSNTTRYNIIFDNTAPSVSISCTPTSVTSGDTVTCGCSGTDATSGVNTTTYTVNPSTTQTGTHTQSCSVMDTAGNVGTSTADFYVTLGGNAPSGGSSGSSNTPVTKTNVFTDIIPSVPATMTGFAADSGVSQIQIEVSATVSNVKVTVDKYASKPAAVSVDKSDTYKYLHVNTQNLGDKLSKATMKIQVEKSWVTSQNIDKTDVALFKYDETNNAWNALTTTYSSEDNTYYYYTVELSSFSYFAIASNKVAEIPPETTPPAEQTPTSYLTWIIIGAVVLVIIGVGIFLNKKKKK